MQKAVNELCGVCKTLSGDLGSEEVDAAQTCIEALTRPLSPDDIRALMSLLPADGDTAYGGNWAILHAIEASPDWPLWDTLTDEANEWVRIFRVRLKNGGVHPP